MKISRTLFPIFLAVAVFAGFLLNHVLTREVPKPETAMVLAAPVGANIFVELSKRVVPSVVNISTTSIQGGGQGSGNQGIPGGPGGDSFREFFEFFFRGRPEGMPAPRRQSQSLGSGFVIDSDGLIMTNNHVIDGADEIKIHFTENPEEKPTDGKVVGRDVELDIALIKVETDRKLVPLALGDSKALEVGEYVMAVGNPIGHGHSVTHGIISAKDRNAPNFPLARYLQTDAPINPGNSGGPLVNLKAEVIGINNAIDARGQGIGFAIPINAVKKILPQLKDKGTVARGYIGVLVNPLTPDIAKKFGVDENTQAPFVAHVYPGEPADKAGLKPYDVVLEVNGKSVRSTQDLIREVTAVEVGQTVPIKIVRQGKELTKKITVSERPTRQKMAQGKPSEKSKPKGVETGMTVETLTRDLKRELGLPADLKGVVVSSLEYEGPASKSGLYRGDVILEVDQKKVGSEAEFFKIVKEKKSYLLRIRRPAPKGQAVFSVVVLDLKS